MVKIFIEKTPEKLTAVVNAYLTTQLATHTLINISYVIDGRNHAALVATVETPP